MGDNKVQCLVVDDDDDVRRALARALERFGYWAVAVASGEAALAVLESREVQVVITDVQMPGMDGVTLLRRIRERWPDVAVVVATGVSEVNVAVACLRIGAHDFITKPFQLDDVGARVAQALDKRHLLIQNQRYQFKLEEMVREQATRIEELFLEGIQALAHALDAKDSYTHGHSARVSAYAGRTATLLGLSSGDVQLTELGAELHDIGKIGVNEDLLRKPGKLTPDEYEQLMDHTLIGARILGPLLKNAPEALAVVRSHHERLDGTGFPDGLFGDQIPIHVRIVSVADSFDAMTTARPYRSALTTEFALDELRRCSGRQFDPEAVAAFSAAFPEGTEFPLPTPERLHLQLPDRVAGVGRLT
jgi:cyclic di-GMP phosphodiesterase